jgi:hypothetical protein
MVKRDEKSNRLCEADGCDKQAGFGSPVDRVTRFCGPHKQERAEGRQRRRTQLRTLPSRFFDCRQTAAVLKKCFFHPAASLY